MQSITQLSTVCLILFLCSANGNRHECGEFNQWGKSSEETIDSESIIFQSLLGDFSSAIKALRENEPYSFLGSIVNDATLTQISLSSDNLLKFVPDRIKAEGYPAEIHQVVTEDGYLLELHRIPRGKNSTKTNCLRPPVFLMHGFMDSSNGWIALGPEHSLAYLLADAGYDVWLGNARGTESSRRHISLLVNWWNQRDYWSFSWHEIGIYDLPASIDYILNETKFKKLNFIGMSQGTTAFLVMASMCPEYNDKIIQANLLSPIAVLKGTTNPAHNFCASNYEWIKTLSSVFRIHKIVVSNAIPLRIAQTVCSGAVDSTPTLCKVILFIFNSNQVNCSSLPPILVGTPSGASVKQFLHYCQLIRSGRFCQFDFDDVEMNQEAYGRDTPPEYNLTRVIAPINLFHSMDDDTAIPENVIQLQADLPNVKSRYVVAVPDFGHVDFLYSRFVRKGLNEQIIKTVNEANQLN